MRKLKKGFGILKDNGLINGSKIIVQKLKSKRSNNYIFTTNKKDIFAFYDYITFENNDSLYDKNPHNEIKILWFIPDFGIGSGGHLNIFRMIFNLSKLGIKSDIAICGDSQWSNKKIAKEMIDKHFFELNLDLIILKNKQDIGLLNPYSIAMATSWQTAYYVKNFNKCYKKTYFVQDFEPYFYAHGSSYVFAENTYNFGFIGISAGSWISEKLKNEYKMDCYPFSFSYDRELYFKHKRKEDKKRVFFYARPPTERRAFELGLIVLNKLVSLNPDIEIVFAGWDVSEYKIDFTHFNAGVVALHELVNLYSQCDVALVLSFTNLSLLPLELLASGCPVVSNKGLNNSWIDKDHKLFVYAENNVEDIVEKLDNLLNKRVIVDFEYIDNFLQQTSWENEAVRVSEVLELIVKKDT